MSVPKWILKYRSLIMQLLSAHNLVGLVLVSHAFWGGGVTKKSLEGKKTLSPVSWVVVMCFLVLTKPCFAADLSNCGDGVISRDHVSCMQINIEAKLPWTQGASIPNKNSLETKCCVRELCYPAFPTLCHSLFKTIFILSFLAKWWHTFICKSPTLWANQCWRGCSLITHQGSGAHEHLPL